jgi:regulator of protease activity HflC (stomatin/prohibitin superfamily)
MDEMVGRVSYRVQQLDVRVETKSLDNVFLTATVSIQFQILREKAYDAYYAMRLSDPKRQITGNVFDVLRFEVPKLDIDSVFEFKEDLTVSVKNALSETMTQYGFQMLHCLIDIDPEQSAKNAKNEKNAAARLKFAAEQNELLQAS